jgi:signal transduction histidine kinase
LATQAAPGNVRQQMQDDGDSELRAVLDAVPAFLVVLKGPELRCTMVNQRTRDLLPGILGKPLREIYPGDNPIHTVMERVYRTGKAETVYDRPAYFPDGTLSGRLFTRTYIPMRDARGNVNGILSVGHEVTEEVTARLLAREREPRSRADMQHVLGLLEEAPVLITVLEGTELKIVMMNRSMRELFAGHPLLGRSFCDLVPPTNLTLQAAKRVYATGNSETIEVMAQDIQTVVGRSFSTTIVPVRDATAGVTHVMNVSFEITAIETARREAVAASRAKDDFLAMLSHELRNPLAPMLTTLELMRFLGTSSPEVELLERQARHLTRLVDDLLDVARITRGKVELKRRVLELSTTVHRALEVSGPLLETRRHRIISDLAPVTVHGDPDRLAQVVANLLTNAAKYSESGSPIRIRVRRSERMAQLSVTDEGVGLAPEMMGSLFEPFSQQPQTLARSRGGLGLGLSIVKHFVEAHGGSVSAYSDGLGRGSTFLIELPAFDEGSAAAQAAPPAAPLQPLANALRVLVVDDVPDVAAAIGEAVRELGQTVEIAHDGPSALVKAATFHPQLAILDIGLPAMDGYELGAALRAAHDLRLVALTGYGHERDRQRSRDAGFEEHMVKPVDFEDIRKLLERLNPSKPSS